MHANTNASTRKCKSYIPLGKIRHKNVIRRHDETRRRIDLGNWLYMKVSRTSFYVATFSRRCDNVVYVAMSSHRFYDVRYVKKRAENFHIQPNIQVLSTSGFDGRRLVEWDTAVHRRIIVCSILHNTRDGPCIYRHFVFFYVRIRKQNQEIVLLYMLYQKRK